MKKSFKKIQGTAAVLSIAALVVSCSPTINEVDTTFSNSSRTVDSDEDEMHVDGKRIDSEKVTSDKVTLETVDNRTVTKMEYEGYLKFTYNSEKAGKAKLNIMAYGIGGYKQNHLNVNGQYVGYFECFENRWESCYNMEINLKAGENEIEIVKDWGWCYIDYIELYDFVYDDAESEENNTPSENPSEENNNPSTNPSEENNGNTNEPENGNAAGSENSGNNNNTGNSENADNGNSGNTTEENPQTPVEDDVEEYVPQEGATVVQAEDADFGSLKSSVFQNRKVVKLEQEGSVTFTVNMQKASRVRLNVMSYGIEGEKTNTLSINGNNVSFISNEDEWTEAFGSCVNLKAGKNEIKIIPSWGWIYIDYIEVIPVEDASSKPVIISGTNKLGVVDVPQNANATKETKALMKYLASGYGERILSGQMDLTWQDSTDMADRVYYDTGKYPAIMGYDFMNYNVGSDGWSGMNQVEEAMEWAKKGGIVTFCWHWFVKNANGENAFYTETASTSNPKTTYKIPYDINTKKWNTTSDEYKTMMKDLDIVAEQLGRLQEEGIPVLWRPLHEASGGWFWWGRNAESYKALYTLMYDYFTNEKKLNNLIWVWNAQNKDWYPGDKYVDIIGYDIYPSGGDYSSQKSTYQKAVNFSDKEKKMVALSENGAFPSVQSMLEDNAYWAYFMTWNDGTASGTDSNNFWSGEYHNSNAHKTEVYNSDYVITLDEVKY